MSAPTLLAYGTNDAVVPSEHATTAADQITGAGLVPVEEAHHLVSLSPGYESVAARQLELIHGV